MQMIPLSQADKVRLARILGSSKTRTVITPEQRAQLAVARQVAIAQGMVIPPELAAVAKALGFDKVIA